ncbi:MAG: UDP-N-acetylglucosamine diphosphorylase/glucosamine-1-phosphate N-acetyltransferase [Proteobacteria bacterium]|nr:MAG: UDP-N-acetylglucosamine diphosphorylase/glucosamine-1-phosphate N-acetyltransferase [Pseudomonadota bacterium]
MSLEVVVLAAGKGTRMRSRLPKVLHPLAGRPLIMHVLERARALDPAQISVVYGHGGDAVPRAIGDDTIRWVLQAEQLGTGHAVQLALPDGDDEDTVVVMYGDIPLIGVDTLQSLASLPAANGGLAILAIELEDPAAYGRIVRGCDGRVTGIVEARDATDAELAIREVNTGFVAAPRGLLRGWLQRLGADNAQGELYLTDIAALAVADGVAVDTLTAVDAVEVQGVNSRAELARLERCVQGRIAADLMDRGVTIADPQRVDVRGKVEAGRDCVFDVNVVLEGRVVIGDGVRIGPNCLLRDVEIGDDVEIHAHSVVEGARIAAGCAVGPFARVRPGTVLERGARLGNFVETKNSRIGEQSKVNHLSYLGDAVVGNGVNIGAGVITCNYDGVNKHLTVVGDDAFVGSDCQLVAPVTIGAGATVGAGTTLTRDAPPGQLTLSRSDQRSIAGWRRPGKKPR